MTKKHFIALAAEFKTEIESLRTQKHGYNCEIHIALDVIKGSIQCVCRVAQRDNPRFDEGRFLKACGL